MKLVMGEFGSLEKASVYIFARLAYNVSFSTAARGSRLEDDSRFLKDAADNTEGVNIRRFRVCLRDAGTSTAHLNIKYHVEVANVSGRYGAIPLLPLEKRLQPEMKILPPDHYGAFEAHSATNRAISISYIKNKLNSIYERVESFSLPLPRSFPCSIQSIFGIPGEENQEEVEDFVRLLINEFAPIGVMTLFRVLQLGKQEDVMVEESYFWENYKKFETEEWSLKFLMRAIKTIKPDSNNGPIPVAYRVAELLKGTSGDEAKALIDLHESIADLFHFVIMNTTKYQPYAILRCNEVNPEDHFSGVICQEVPIQNEKNRSDSTNREMILQALRFVVCGGNLLTSHS